MKLLLVLLACIAAANAFSGSYSYYSQRNFCVYPTAKYYRYTIYFPSTWCSSSYYTPIVKSYPGEDCGKDGWQERDVADVVTEMSNCLKAALLKMQSSLSAKRTTWIKQIDACHAEYKTTFVKYITQYYNYRSQCNPGVNYDAEKQAKIAAYCKTLAEKRSEIIAKYDAAVAAKIKSVVEYHAKLVKAASECLETRVKKIQEYKESVAKKIHENTINFAKTHLAIAKQKKEQYKAILTALFDSVSDWYLSFKASIVLDKYGRDQRAEIEKLIRVYVYKQGIYQKKLVDYYTCAYKCYLSNGCLRFYKRSYYSHCKTLGSWCAYKTGYCYTRYSIRPFCVRYTAPVYKGLKTCDVNAATSGLEKAIAEMIRKRDEVLAEHTKQYNDWKIKWLAYSLQYKAKYEQCVKERHDWWLSCVKNQYLTCNRGAPLTPEQIAALAKLKKELEEKAAAACTAYYTKLLDQINACAVKYNKEQAMYRKMVDDLIVKIRANFKACTDKRTASIAAYKKKLEESTAANRSLLIKKWQAAKTAHWKNFGALMEHYHGKEWTSDGTVSFMSSCYATQLIGKCNRAVAEYDSYWRSMIPKLVMNYSCGYTCRVYACRMPTYSCGTYYTWRFSLPKSSAYTYKYSYYYKYRYC